MRLRDNFESPPAYHFLIHAAVQPVTLKGYRHAIRTFLVYVDVEERPLPVCFDVLLAEFFFFGLYCNGIHWSKGVKLLSAFNTFLPLPHLSGNFPIARRALQGYKRLKPTNHTVPMPWGVCVLFANTLLQDRRFGSMPWLLLLTAFDGYLRCSDYYQVRCKDVVFEGNECFLIIRKPKGHTSPHHVRIRTRLLVSSIRERIRTMPRDTDRLFDFAPTQLRKVLKLFCRRFDIDAPFVPHSLRAGGATADLLKGVPFENIQRRGRWAQPQTARGYTNPSACLLSSRMMPATTTRLIEQAVRDHDILCSQIFPPEQDL
jgi:integrase